jgi:hypothetical protein
MMGLASKQQRAPQKNENENSKYCAMTVSQISRQNKQPSKTTDKPLLPIALVSFPTSHSNWENTRTLTACMLRSNQQSLPQAFK